MNRKAAFLILAFFALIVAGCTTNPISGESQFMLFSEEQDIELGKNYAPEVEKEMGGRIQNLMLQNYINSVGQNVARVSHKPFIVKIGHGKHSRQKCEQRDHHRAEYQPHGFLSPFR